MATSVEQLLASRNLIGLIQGVVSGVPDNLVPTGFFTTARACEGNRATYFKVNGTRQTARLVQYGSASQKRELRGISEVPITLLHTFEHENHPAAVYMNLINENNEQKQKLGMMTVSRQIRMFGDLFRNLRISSLYSALALGGIYFDAEGNLLSSSTGATLAVDFRIPAGNTGQLDVFGDGDLLTAKWSVATTDLFGQIKAVKDAAVKLTGYPLKYAFYGRNIPGYFAANTYFKEMMQGSPRLAEATAASELPDPLAGLSWRSVSEAMFVDADGNLPAWFDADTVVFTPEPSPDWYEFLEGTYPVPRTSNLSQDAAEAMRTMQEVAGPFSYAEITMDPPGVKHYAGDTFLPVIKVPSAIFIAKVVW